MTDPPAGDLCLPSKNDLMQRLRKDGYKFGSVLDVGVMTATRELLDHFADLPQLLCEPVEEFHNKIRNTYNAASVDFVLEHRAISSSSGTAELDVKSKSGGKRITHATLATGAATSPSSRAVGTVTLDESVAEHQMKPPYLLKIDVDGFELAVLEGATQTLEHTAVVVIEAFYHRFSAIDAALSTKGFQIYDVIDICYYDRQFWQCDLVFYNAEVARNMGVVRKDSVEDLSKYHPFRPEDLVGANQNPAADGGLDAASRVELENLRLLAPSAIRELAKSGPLDAADWRSAMQENPTNVTRWNALRRAARRLAGRQS